MKTTAEDNLAVSDSEGAFGAIVSGDWFLVSPHMLIGAIGSVACFAWVFLALGSGAFASPSAIGLSGESGVYHLTFIVAFTISLLLSWAMAGVFSKRRAACLGVSVGLTAAGFVCMWLLSTSPLVVAIGAVLFGLGIGLVYCLYGELMSWFFFNSIKRYILGLFLAATLCSFVVLACGFPAGTLIATVFPIVAFVCYAAELPYLKANMPASISSAESDSRCRVKVRSYLATATAGLVSGFAFGGIFISSLDSSLVLGGGLPHLLPQL